LPIKKPEDDNYYDAIGYDYKDSSKKYKKENI
jgi:hypothetical protein